MRKAREKGILLVTWVGWQELVSKYWFLSVGFLYRSIIILPSEIRQDVSKNASEFNRPHSQSGLMCSFMYGRVWFIVNFIVGWISLSSAKNECNWSSDPLKSMKMSSRNLLKNLIWFSLSSFFASSSILLSIFFFISCKMDKPGCSANVMNHPNYILAIFFKKTGTI